MAGTECRAASRSVWWCWSDLTGCSLPMEPDWNSPPENSEETKVTKSFAHSCFCSWSKYNKCTQTVQNKSSVRTSRLLLNEFLPAQWTPQRAEYLPGESWRCSTSWTPSALRSQLEDGSHGTSPSPWPDRRSPAPQTPAGFTTSSSLTTRYWAACMSFIFTTCRTFTASVCISNFNQSAFVQFYTHANSLSTWIHLKYFFHFKLYID